MALPKDCLIHKDDFLRCVPFDRGWLIVNWFDEKQLPVYASDITVNERGTCGINAVNKLIDIAFYSIDKLLCDIRSQDVMKAISDERRGVKSKRKIDSEKIIKSIDATHIYWTNTSGGESKSRIKDISEKVKKLKKYHGCHCD